MSHTDAAHRYSTARHRRPVLACAARAQSPVLTAEDPPTYAGASVIASEVADVTEAPFGLPVLAELPELGGALKDLVDADRCQVRAALTVARLRETDRVETITGVPLEHWLGIVARQTRLDRRLLLRLCGHFARFPALRDGAERGRLSFAQLRGLSLALRDAPTAIDAELDRWLAAAIDALDETTEPDALVRQLARAIGELAPTVTAEAEQRAAGSRYAHLQPRLDGSGGTLRVDEDALGFAIIEAALALRPDQLDHPGGGAAARADNLQRRLTHTCDEPGPADRTGAPAADGPGGAAPSSRAAAATWLEEAVTSTWRRPPAVKVLVRMDLDALLDRAQTPASILTRLVGGRLRLTADVARRLVDARGAELRAIVVDDCGQVVGVGRSTRVAPGWLEDATLALHDTCTGPLCELPARDAQLDHASPWWPTRPGDPFGSTDLDNIGPLCAPSNRRKEQAGWSADQTGNGQRSWHHRRSGLTVTTVPATWRPPGHRPRKRAPDRHDESGTDPPGADPAGDLHRAELDEDGHSSPF